MSISRAAALLYVAICAGVAAFQIALAAGAPWGAYAMGGAVPGQLPLEDDAVQEICCQLRHLPLVGGTKRIIENVRLSH